MPTIVTVILFTPIAAVIFVSLWLTADRIATSRLAAQLCDAEGKAQ